MRGFRRALEGMTASVPRSLRSSQAVGVVGPVGDQSFDWASSEQQLLRHHDVMDVARRDQQNPGPVGGVGEGVDRCRASAARASYVFFEGAPFPPAAERVNALNMASQMASRLHRLKRS